MCYQQESNHAHLKYKANFMGATTGKGHIYRGEWTGEERAAYTQARSTHWNTHWEWAKHYVTNFLHKDYV